MKVLVFTTLFPNNVWPNHGVFVKERMCEVARLDDCEVKVVAPVPYYPCIRVGWRAAYRQVVPDEIIDGVHVYHPRYVMIPKVGMALHGLMLFLSVYFFVKKRRRNFDFDVIDAHYVYPDGFAAVLLSRCFQRRVVVSARGSDINQFSRFPLIRRLLQYTLRRADKVIGVCQALKNAMVALKIPAEKITVVPNGVDHKKFYPASKNEARQRLRLPLDKRIILSVGGLIRRKGFDLIINALKLVSEESRVSDCFLVIIGEGPQRRALEILVRSRRLDDRVFFAGAIPHNELHVWYSAADLFCLASSREGWPNVLLESLACGTPVVAANIWGIPEIITSDEVGLLTDRTEDAIAEKIVLALRKQWQTESLLEHAKKHTWERTALGVLRVFRGLLKEKNEFPDKYFAGRVI